MHRRAILLVLVSLLMTPAIARAEGPAIDLVQAVGDPYQGALTRLGDVLRAVFGSPAERSMEPPITGTVWKWQVTQFSDDRRIAVPAPERYTIQFGEDGRLSVRADCNLGVGAYRREGGRIDIGPLALTRAACPADSLDGPFLAQLERVTGVTRDGDQLVLLLSFDSGAMIFVP